jgi:hypothetical protein
MSVPQYLASDGAHGSGDKNVGERDPQKGPSHYALQSVHAVMDSHAVLPSDSLNRPGKGWRGVPLRALPWMVNQLTILGAPCLRSSVSEHPAPARIP